MMAEKEFELGLFKKASKLVEKYKIKYNPEDQIPTDEMADDVYSAAIELVCDVGMYHMDTHRCIKFDEDEVREHIGSLPSELLIGEGKERVRFAARRPESNDPPLIGAGHVRCSESVARELYISLAQLPNIHWLEGYVTTHTRGMPLRGGPYDVIASLREMRTLRDSITEAGAPGKHLMFYCISPTAACYIASMNPDYGIRKTDAIRFTHLTEMKIEDNSLSAVPVALNYGCFIQSGGFSFLGGYAGGPEGVAITTLASAIGDFIVFRSNWQWRPNTFPLKDPDKEGKDPEVVWSANLATLAFARNIPAPQALLVVSGPESGNLFRYLEIASNAISVVPFGAHLQLCRPTVPLRENLMTPLEAQFLGEVGRAAAKQRLKREEAYEISRKLLKKTEHLYNLPIKERKKSHLFIGKPFEELYDMKTLRPKDEELRLYEMAKKSVVESGLHL